jgi:alkaline phosphatase
MVEGAHIDKQSHLMDADRVIGETIEFDNAVRVARDFAREHEGTLVLVLADHECSGFSLIGALTGGMAHLNGLAPDNGVVDPATQPARQTVVGTYDAAGFPHYDMQPDGYPATFDIDNKILVGFGASGDRYEGWLGKPLPVVDGLLPTDIRSELIADGYAAQPYLRAESGFGFFLRGQAVGRDQAVHTATDIPVSAYSRGDAWLSFVGVQANTDVFFKIARLVFGPRLAAPGGSVAPGEDDVVKR